jgi:hypothetical protein
MDGMRSLNNLRPGIQDLKQTLPRSHGHLKVVPAKAQIADRFKKAMHIQNESHQGSRAQMACHHQRAAIDDHQGNGGHTNHFNGRKKQRREPSRMQIRIQMLAVDAHKTLHIVRLTN